MLAKSMAEGCCPNENRCLLRSKITQDTRWVFHALNACVGLGACDTDQIPRGDTVVCVGLVKQKSLSGRLIVCNLRQSSGMAV